MATKKKALQAAAGAAGAGEAVYIDSLFSTYLYTGNGSTQTITNGIDLDGEGGLVWIKDRTSAYANTLFDTERGATKGIRSNTTEQEYTLSTSLTAFNADGFTLGSYSNTNFSGNDIASWTFRKAPGFFDVVTYTGTGSAGLTIDHNLGCVPGCIMVKRLDISGDRFQVYHKGYDSDTYPAYHYKGDLSTAAFANDTMWNDTAPTSTQFQLGARDAANASGGTYVAYLFADGDDAAAQIFGTDGDQAVVKCGSYTGNSSNDGPEIDLGFEPQFLIIKAAQRTANWFLWDTMRGLTVANIANSPVYINLSNAEYTGTTYVEPTSTGFKITDNANDVNSSLSGYNQYIYIAIRRPHKPAESGTEVFAVDTRSGTPPSFVSNFPVDMGIWKDTDGSSGYIADRLRGAVRSKTDSTNAESAAVAYRWDYQNGYYESTTADTTIYSWMFKRSPGFFDVVCYTGTGSATTVNHNLGVAPEMMIIKNRSDAIEWAVYHSGLGNVSFPNPEDNRLTLNSANASQGTGHWNNTAPTESVFSIGGGSEVGVSGDNYIAYLFASQDGISKVGSYTGDGTTDGSHVIDCGFTNGARFVLIKVASGASGKWHVYDTERGITVGTDGALFLDSTEAENTTFDGVDPASSGFAPKHGYTNYSGREYIYLAIS